MSQSHAAWLARQRLRWLRPDAHRYMRADAKRYIIPDSSRSLRPDFERFLLPAFVEGKANFNPNQPRAPAGNPDGGRWTRDGTGGEPAEVTEPANPDSEGRSPLRITIHPRNYHDDEASFLDFSFGDWLPIKWLLDLPFEIHERRPTSARQRNAIIRQIAKRIAHAVVKVPLGPVGVVITVAEVANWVHEGVHLIQSYQDPPKTLQELQQAVSQRKRGYDIHHIVEEDAAEKEGFPQSLINSRDNRVLIPRIRHWEVTGWFMTPNEDFGGLSSREYLRGKEWVEKVRVGRLALIKVGVMKP